MMRVFAFYWLIVSITSFAQQKPLKKIKEVKLQSGITTISVDRLGGFYTISDCGIEQFDSLGNLKKKYPVNGCNPTELLEAWSLMRIYAYQNYKQQFTVFTSHMEEVDKLDIDASFAVEPRLATPASDLRHYWILDIDNSLKRVSLKLNAVDIETDALKTVDGKFVYLREYQNLLFLLHEHQGIYVINNLGNLVFIIPAERVNYFSFTGEDLYYLKGDQIQFYNIFTKDTYSVKVLPGFQYAVATDERLILIKDAKAEIFEFAPRK